MTIEEASKKYCIPIKLLKEYESMELCGTVKRVMGVWQYDDTDIERLSMIMTLHDIGFSKEDIDEYMQLLLSGQNNEECIKMLEQKRKGALSKIHVLEKRIDNIDYLRNEMRSTGN
ncbi:MAG TPA: MerR family transcriptional regulator [Candidatus Ornithomonoglobus merdipullorum]|uniref:MerR family transcriptional regulator n=1 Tax=Candidatus Ornithomonoglobus merdipullorum TaxID=2840895 RepID=A0A9D1SF97_9FIRM|nr:MerR family transcriptional regulator [Candidatus Ornithomonoglobus merdipullorum]